MVEADNTLLNDAFVHAETLDCNAAQLKQGIFLPITALTGHKPNHVLF